MTPEQNDLYRFRTGYLKFRSALCDRNTGLVSYVLLFDEIRRLLESRERIAILLAELTEIHRMESIYGWQACDRLLSQASTAVRTAAVDLFGEAALATQDAVHGGRYVLFVPQIPPGEPVSSASADRAALDLRERLDGVFAGDDFAGMAARVGFTTGWSLLTDDPFIRFERAVHEAVRTASRPAGEREAQLEAEREIYAVLRDGGLDMLFQPIVELESGRVLGYEALARGPAGSRLETPAMLFASAEAVGLSAELDRACRERALATAPLLESADDLLFVNFLPVVLDVAADDGLWTHPPRGGRMPERIVLEVAERRLHQAGTDALRTLSELKALGLRLAIDNAGSGYSTARLIQDLKPDYVKIDRTLVRGIDGNLMQQEVARSVVALAGRAGCSVVAAGIETEAEARAVRRCGVVLGQGFHLGPPRPPAPYSARRSDEARGATGP